MLLRRLGFVALVLLAPGLGRCEEQLPEQLLPVGAQVYLRWDGHSGHEKAYAQTAIGKILQGDTGAFLRKAGEQLQDALTGFLQTQQVFAGIPPEQLQKMQGGTAMLAKLFEQLCKHGFVFAVEAQSIMPPLVQATLILPNAGADPAPLFDLLQLATSLAHENVKEKKIKGRTVHQIMAGQVPIAWWVEGKHALLTVGTISAQDNIKRLEDKSASRLTDHPLFKRVQGFRQFETNFRGFVDVSGILKQAQTVGFGIDDLLKDLGVDGFRSVVFYSGYAGPAERGVVELDAEGPRKGLLTLFNAKPFTLEDVPPLPEDVTHWAVSSFDWAAFYDVGVQAAERILRLASPKSIPLVKQYLHKADAALGVDIRQDLLGSLGDRVAFYLSPAEGFFTLGAVEMIQVKDPKKLQDSLDAAMKGIAKTTGAPISVRKRLYRGVELREIHVRKQGFFFLPTYTIHKGWIVVGFYPQAVHGFLLRTKGELPAWKPSGRAAEAFASLPKEFVSVSYSDPRPTVKFLLSLTPLAANLVKSLIGDDKFDTSLVPNTHEVLQHLFPNVSVGTDDGKTRRIESLHSLPLPF